MTHSLDIESLTVETFETTGQQAVSQDPNDPFQPIIWTGCDSACGECGMGVGKGF